MRASLSSPGRSAGLSVVLSVAAALLALLLASFVGCGSESGPDDGARELTVSAAAGLRAAFTEIGQRFDEANSTKTTFNFDAAGTLQKQIEGGAPADVFASAAIKQVDALLEQGLLDADSVVSFASNEIVVVVPADSALDVSSFEDLGEAEVKRVTYGDPAATASGVAAEEVLVTLGLTDQVKRKVIYAANVSQALTYVSSGEVDAGIVWVTEALPSGDKVNMVATSDPDWHNPVVFPMGVVSAAKNKTLAEAFVEYVTGPEGQSILRKHGFLAAPSQ